MSLSVRDHIEQARTSIREVSVQQLRDALQGEAPPLLLDVREHDETTDGVISNAITIPRGLLELRIEEIASERATPIAVYCAGGSRSVLAAHCLMTLGYEDVVSVTGGVQAWCQAGFPLTAVEERGSDPLDRYARQMVLPQVGAKGQRKLLQAKVLCVGAGGLGSPVALYLAAGGIGTLGIIDDDAVEISNLQRQILHREASLGTPKVDSARQALSELNGDIEINTYHERLTAKNVMKIFEGYDLVVDGTDNFPTRYLINDACVLLGIPNVHGSVFHFDGQCTVFAYGDGPCYRCLFPQPPPAALAPNCAESGVLGAMCGVIGAWQAMEAIKVLLDAGDTLAGRLMSIDAMGARVHTLAIRRDPQCPVCGEHPTISAPTDGVESCGAVT